MRIAYQLSWSISFVNRIHYKHVFVPINSISLYVRKYVIFEGFIIAELRLLVGCGLPCSCKFSRYPVHITEIVSFGIYSRISLFFLIFFLLPLGLHKTFDSLAKEVKALFRNTYWHIDFLYTLSLVSAT